jgi:hypothetical protein
MRTLKETMLYHWKLACEFDGLVPDKNKVYVFSSNNPYRISYNAFSRIYWKSRYPQKGK